MPSVPTAPAAISAALAALDAGARLQAAGAMLDRLDEIADRDANRPLFESCDALLEALPRDDTRTLDRWLAGREPASRPSLYLRARLAHAAGQLTAAAGHWDALFRGTPPADANVLLLYARVLADVGRFSDAAERLRHALRCRPPYSFYPRVRTLLATYAKAGGRDACLLFHDAAGAEVIHRLGRRGKGLPARVIPVELHHMAAAGIDTWLGALAYGASDVAVLATGTEAPQYPEAIARQMGYADTIAQALGYQGRHLHLLRAADAAALEAAVWALQPALPVRAPATFHWSADKRTTAALAIEHLQAHAPTPQTVIALAAGAPFGTIAVNRDACTLCLACVGACPEGAILDHPASEVPQLRFIESKCVQCGLCEATCPEDAIALTPRLSLAAEAKQPRVLNEASILIPGDEDEEVEKFREFLDEVTPEDFKE